MKKFGTPIGAGPGSDSENVGFELLGTPLPVGSLAAGLVVVVVFLFALLFCLVLADGVWPWLDDFSGDEEVGYGVVLVVVVFVVLVCEGEVEVEVVVVVVVVVAVVVAAVDEVEVEEEEVEEEAEEEAEDELDELGDMVVVVVVVVVVDEDDEVVVVAHVIVSEMAPEILTGGMTPGVAITGPTVCVSPSARVTVTVHVSA